MSILDCDVDIMSQTDLIINICEPLIIDMIENKMTDMTYFIKWRLNKTLYKYNQFTKQLESTLYDFDPRHWFIYQKWGTTELIICKQYLGMDEQRILKLSPIHFYGTYENINLEILLKNQHIWK